MADTVGDRYPTFRDVDWAERERELRQREVHFAGWSVVAQVEQLLDLRPRVVALGDDALPALDLSNVQLDGLTGWAGAPGEPGIDFSGLAGHFSAGIDLRGGNFQHTRWDGSSLNGAHLQCTNFVDAQLDGVQLRGADLRGADLSRADLRGADLTNADLRNANLNGVHFDGANLTDAHFGGAIANEVTREGAEGSEEAYGAPDVWTRLGEAPIGTWRGSGEDACLEAYSR